MIGNHPGGKRDHVLAVVLVVLGALLVLAALAARPIHATRPSSVAAQDKPTPTGPGGPVVVEEAQLSRPEAWGDAPAEPAAVVMSQNFEGAWPASGWSLSDQSSNDGGEFLWGKRNCRPRTGSYGGWSVGGGAQGSALACSANYPNHANTWAEYGPFNLSNATSASLTFYFWGRVEYEANWTGSSPAVRPTASTSRARASAVTSPAARPATATTNIPST